jgi:hypothetical protein
MMAHDKDGPSKHIARLIEEAKPLKGYQRNGGWVSLTLLGDLSALRAAHKLRRNTDLNKNPALRAAFEAFSLDSSKQEDWRLLLAWFAEAHFLKRGPGKEKRWDEDALCQLLVDFRAAKKATKGKLKGEIYKFLAKRKNFNGRYADMTANAIQRNLRDARDPAKNALLGHLLEAHLTDPRHSPREYLIKSIVETIAESEERAEQRAQKAGRPR